MRLSVLISAALLLFSCSQPLPESFSVCFYNAYLLFDSAEDGWEYEGFRRSDGYTEDAYRERIRDLAIMLARNTSCDVIVLAEVESEEVLADLISSGLGLRGFRYYGLAKGSEPLSVGFISKERPDAVRIHSTDGARPFLEMSFGSFTILGVHARSRLETGSDAVRFRQFSHIGSILSSAEGLAFAIGDFNADPRYPEDGMAMYPSAGWADIPLNVTTDPGKAGGNILYSPLIDEGGAEGTYWYMDGWYFYDNALLCSSIFSSSEWRYASSRVIRPFEAEDILGRPDAYDASTGSGYSDHFPIEVTFVSF